MVVEASSSIKVNITLSGITTSDGDHVKWVAAGSPCSALVDDKLVDANKGTKGGSAFFTFAQPGVYSLCYNFRYHSAPRPTPPTGWLAFPEIQVAAVRIAGVTPTATGVSCRSNLTITGLHLRSLGAATPPAWCRFGLGDTAQLMKAEFAGDALACETISTTNMSTLPFSVVFDGSEPIVVPGGGIVVFNATEQVLLPH